MQDLQLDHKVGGGMNGWGGEDEWKDILGGRSCLGKGDEIGHTQWPGGCRWWRWVCVEKVSSRPSAEMPVVPGQEAWT